MSGVTVNTRFALAVDEHGLLSEVVEVSFPNNPEIEPVDVRNDCDAATSEELAIQIIARLASADRSGRKGQSLVLQLSREVAVRMASAEVAFDILRREGATEALLLAVADSLRPRHASQAGGAE